MLDDFDLDFSEDEDSPIGDDGGQSNRTFLMVAGGLGALLIISLLCIGGYWFLQIRPEQAAQADNVTNTAIAQLTGTMEARTQTAEALIPTATTTPTTTTIFTDTPTATNTLVVATDTPTNTPGGPTDTPGPTDTIGPTNTPGGPTDTPEPPTITPGGPTADPRTATVQALLTQASLAQTQAAELVLTVSPTASALPDTGFIDDAGGPALFGLAGLLLLVIFVARRLREAAV